MEAPMEPPTDLSEGEDGLLRCWWAAGSPALERYHDLEWGRGARDERSLFERLSLETLQSGLSWRLVLERREALRETFAGFDPRLLARRSEADIERMLATPGTIRNRAKVAAIVHNAGVHVELWSRGSGLADLTEGVLTATPTRERPAPEDRTQVPASTPTSHALAQELRAVGWRFIGPVTAYAYLQATGWVDDHLRRCTARGASVQRSSTHGSSEDTGRLR